MTEPMPPKSTADNLEKRTVALPPDQWAACEDIADRSGEKLSEVYRRIFALGVSAERDRLTADQSYRNKQLVGQRLKAKQEGALEALDILRNPTASTEARMAALEKFEAWLRKG
jgi:hypothetical protein